MASRTAWPSAYALACMFVIAMLGACSGDDESLSYAGNGGAGDGDGDGSGGSDDPFGNPTETPEMFGDASANPNGVQNSGDDDGGSGDCSDALVLVLRDFTETHPDFEHFSGSGLDGIVKEDLGADHKPQYASDGPTELTSGPDGFADWYHDVPGVNQRVEVDIHFTETSPGTFVYDNSMFFPIDGQGFGNGPPGHTEHNFLFTTEAHTQFTYKGGEVFTFVGDDDLWVFVNGKLAVDLGGLHARLEESIDFDANADRLGIEVGKTYPMDIFHAERHTVESNFRIETTIDLSCIDNISVD